MVKSPELRRGTSYVTFCVERPQGIGSSPCKDPEAGACMARLARRPELARRGVQRESGGELGHPGPCRLQAAF